MNSAAENVVLQSILLDVASKEFAKELNNNISNINMNISLNNWKYSNDNYPTF